MRVGVISPNGRIGKALVEKTGAIPINCELPNYFSVELEISKEKPDIVVCTPENTDILVYEDKEEYTKIHGDIILGTHNVGSVLANLRIPGIFVFPAHHMWSGGFAERHSETSKITPAKSRFGMAMTAAEFVATQTGMKSIRTSAVFDRKFLEGKIRALSEGQRIYEPAFVTRSFIHMDHLINGINLYIRKYRNLSGGMNIVDHIGMPKTLNIAGGKSPSLYAFMRELAEQMGFDKKLVRPVLTEKSPFPRPWNGSLDISASLKMGFPYVDYVSGIGELLNES